RQIQHDAKQPGFAIRPWLILFEGAPRSQQRLLHQVLSFGTLPAKARCGAQQALAMDHRHFFKLLLPRQSQMNAGLPCLARYTAARKILAVATRLAAGQCASPKYMLSRWRKRSRARSSRVFTRRALLFRAGAVPATDSAF